jgi:hypothetical protein
MESGGVRFLVKKRKVNWGALFRDMMRGSSPSGGATFENPSGGGYVVVAQNSKGAERILSTANTKQEANEQVGAAQRDFATCDAVEWCERHQLPPSFVSG